MRGIDIEYNLNYEAFKKDYVGRRQTFYRNPSIAYFKPFRIFGNLYYIGDKRVCSHLVETDEGLIVFDSGHHHTIHLLVQSIWELGFDPADIKYLIHTHGHFDHIGACNEFRALYKCTTVMSRADTEMLRDKPEGALMELSSHPDAILPIIDKTFEDGEIITLGNTSIRCVLTPGHSPGNSAFFFDVRDKKQTCTVAYFGGAGFNWLRKGFLDRYNFPYSLREEFLKSIDKVRCEKADIVLGSHPGQYDLFEKRKRLEENPENNPFIDPGEWEMYLTGLKTRYQEFLMK